MIMETYTVRTADGVMIATLAGQPAENIFKNVKGEWRTYKSDQKKRTVCYEVKEDSVWGNESQYGEFKMYLWEGTIIIKD